jgi:hypothetical protein
MNSSKIKLKKKMNKVFVGKEIIIKKIIHLNMKKYSHEKKYVAANIFRVSMVRRSIKIKNKKKIFFFKYTKKS